MAESTSRRGPGRPRKNPLPTEETVTTEIVKPKQKRNRPDLANFGQEYVQPGDNSRYLAHAMSIARLPLIDLNDVHAVEERVELYFEMCFNSDLKPTVAGLCNALSIDRKTLLNWRNGKYRDDTCQAVALRAYNMMEELWEHYMQNGKINPVSGIFLGKNNYGYQDKQEHVITPNTTTIETVDAATIEAKYAELPCEEE